MNISCHTAIGSFAALVTIGSVAILLHVGWPMQVASARPEISNSISEAEKKPTSTLSTSQSLGTADGESSDSLNVSTTSTVQLLDYQLQCSQMEVGVILHFVNNYYEPTPYSNFLSRSHFDTKLGKCFVELQYSQYCGIGYTDACNVKALYDATDDILLQCYLGFSDPTSQAGCDDPKDNGIDISTTTYDRTLDRYMTE